MDIIPDESTDESVSSPNNNRLVLVCARTAKTSIPSMFIKSR